MEKIMGIIRHILTFVAGLLVSRGILDEGMVMELIGAIMAIIGFVLSVLNKDKALSANPSGAG